MVRVLVVGRREGDEVSFHDWVFLVSGGLRTWHVLSGYFSKWRIASWRNLVEWRLSDIRGEN